MGNIYRFVEPVVLLMLNEHKQAYGYELASQLESFALTDAEIEGAALYRTLRRLEQHGYVQSEWDTAGSGPARRVYVLTRDGRLHLEKWGEVLDHLAKAMARFSRRVKASNGAKPNAKRAAAAR
jgi:DNA-binding PadR family transcriptional regulator